MVYDTTYPNKRISHAINGTVGAPYSFLQRLKSGGIGSKRMIVVAVCPQFQHYFKLGSFGTKANVELRPKGIIIHFRQKLESYAWTMAFDGLTVSNETHLTISFHDQYITFGEPVDGYFASKLEKQLK